MSEIFSSIPSGPSENNSRNRFSFDTFGSSNRSDSESNTLNESWSGIVTSFTVYKLLTDIIQPFTSMKAYQAGLIDANGNILKDEKGMTNAELNVLTPYTRLVIGIKRLVQALPANRYKADFGYIQTAARAMAFECAEVGGSAELFLEELEKSLNVLLEEGDIGNASGDAPLNPQVGEPNPALAGFSPPLAFVRRLPTNTNKRKIKLKRKRKRKK
jgi:hypothetical protein